MAFCCYLSFLCLLPLLFNRQHDFVHFHKRQGLVLWIWTMLAIFLLFVPVIGGAFFIFSAYALRAFSLAGMLSVMLNRRWRLPGVIQLAELL